MSREINNTSFELRPDSHTSLEIQNLSGEVGSIVWNTTTEALVTWIGNDWVTLVTNPPTGAAPFLITASIGGSSTHSSHNSEIYMTWTGVSGTYELTLPDASEHSYRTIRVINDGTVNASDKIHVLAPNPQTIDGAAFYTLNKPYGGVTVWSDGSNWIVIQAKS
tara:strand:+ start:59 stop:550 length:492 start_codon:yes stop_codon:yes gene_type:complete